MGIERFIVIEVVLDGGFFGNGFWMWGSGFESDRLSLPVGAERLGVDFSER